jgi:hypothetical protein
VRTARALERDDDELTERAMNSVRDLRDRLTELSRTRRASSRVVRHSLVWRTRMAGWCARARTRAILTCSAAAVCCSHGPHWP